MVEGDLAEAVGSVEAGQGEDKDEGILISIYISITFIFKKL
jgi:hypothetical protein